FAGSATVLAWERGRHGGIGRLERSRERPTRATASHPKAGAQIVSNPLTPGSLQGKRVLVTGSSRGIGADTVRYFAEAGADIVVNYRNKGARAEKLGASLRELGGRVLVVGADLTDPASVKGMFDRIEAEYGGLDIL